MDMASVLDLGYGPISVERADELVEAGKAEKVFSDGKWRYRRKGTMAYEMPLFTERLKERFG